MNIIMLGAPGAGKGTQAAVLCEHFGIPTISTGNMIREALKNGTEMGLKAKSYMDEGKLVPDEVVIGIVKERLSADDCKDGFILDGFPRTIPVCDDCGGTLVQRKDDHPDTVLARLAVYHKETEPLANYYDKQGKLVNVKGMDTVEATTEAVLKAIEA